MRRQQRSTILLIALSVVLVGIATATTVLSTVGVAIDQEVSTSAPNDTARFLRAQSSFLRAQSSFLRAQSSFQSQLLAAVNKKRAAVGVAALCMSSKLQSSAQRHSNDMASGNFMSHTGSDGSSMSQRITDSGFDWTAIAENVAAGQKDVAAVMKSWMSSSGHRKNILSSKYKMFGCGYAYNSKSTYKYYWTQDFGAGSGESCSGSSSSPTPTSKPVTKAPAVTTKAPSTSSTMQQQMLAAVNKQRAAAGLSKLCMNSKLQSAAQGHSNDMAKNDYMSHTGSDGSSMSQRITDSGYSWNYVAENVAAGQTDVDSVMTSWMNSPGHRANILSSEAAMFGCAYAYNADSTYKHYWTQDFGTGSSESCS